MNDTTLHYCGGCLCGALRYEASADPLVAGYCFCNDCQRASGSGFIPFMGFSSTALRFNGRAKQFTSKSVSGGDAVRNFCSQCNSLVFGGELEKSDSFTIYAGTLDDRAAFRPTIAIFAANRPPWVPLPPHLKVFDGLPSR